MTKLITPPAVLRDPHVDKPETRETGDPIFNITLEFASEEDVKPLADEISRLMPKNGSTPLRKIQTPAGQTLKAVTMIPFAMEILLGRRWAS